MNKKAKGTLKALALLSSTFLIGKLSSQLLSAFGKSPSGDRFHRILRSANFKQGAFQNISPTPVMLPNASMLKVTKQFIFKQEQVKPAAPIPSVHTNLKRLHSAEPTLVWFGHSSYMILSKGFNILVDPVFSGNASPVSFFGKSFEGSDVYDHEDMPVIDLLVITHDHYDHLDQKTIQSLNPKVKQFITPLGVGEHLEYWGVKPEKITELDWQEEKAIEEGVKLTATSARHFSGRAFKRGRTLWAAYVLELHGYKILLGGDSGYDTHFKDIGEQYGPFDLAILEAGQFGENWPHIHMFPEETVRAAMDLKTKALLPVHWGKFVLSTHRWNAPIEGVVSHAKLHNLSVLTPQIGESVQIGAENITKAWWS